MVGLVVMVFKESWSVENCSKFISNSESYDFIWHWYLFASHTNDNDNDNDNDDEDEDEDYNIISQITAESIINSNDSVVVPGALITVNENHILNADIAYQPIATTDTSGSIINTQSPPTIATEPIAAHGVAIDYDNSFSIIEVANTSYRTNSVRWSFYFSLYYI